MSSSEIILSIIIPVYNSEKYLNECLDSICKQQTNYKFEVVCVDDGSTDSSYDILQYYSQKHSEIRVLKNKMVERVPLEIWE